MLNTVQLCGRLTAEPIAREGADWTRFTLAVDRDYPGVKKEADFIPCIAWREKSTFARKYLHKGTFIAIHGRLQYSGYIDRTGARKTDIVVVVEDVYFLQSKSEAPAPRKEQPKPAQPVFEEMPGPGSDNPFAEEEPFQEDKTPPFPEVKKQEETAAEKLHISEKLNGQLERLKQTAMDMEMEDEDIENAIPF